MLDADLEIMLTGYAGLDDVVQAQTLRIYECTLLEIEG
jgi:hypothetical protein